MAKSKSLKGVDVSIVINGIKVTEYEDPRDETKHDYPKKTVLRYIEAISGTNYSILNEVSSGYKLKSALSFSVQVDSWTRQTNPLFVQGEDASPWTPWTYKVEGKEYMDYKGVQWEKPFKFSPLKIVDADDKDRIKRDAHASKNIGEIRVTVRRKQAKEKSHYSIRGKDSDTSLEIAEKAVKGQSLSHGTEFGEATRCRELTTITKTKPQRGSHDPAAVFIFRYRSREALQAEHIIPRDQSPDILQDIPEEDIRRMARERLSQNEDNKVKIKREANVNGQLWAKRSTEDKNYMIDLTGDGIPDFEEAKAPKPPRETMDLRY
ncbi:hypothetical protein VE03_05970 [Pseudogymnoascus sp. 23342-1-I1]|nr:hypothetical protein VE03_05970 [Pseudogymnoascus sp. 23342-1-I1]